MTSANGSAAALSGIDGEGAAARFVREQKMQRRKQRRHHQRRGRALRQPRRDQLHTRLRKPAPQRDPGEADNAGHKDILCAGDQTRTVLAIVCKVSTLCPDRAPS